MGFSVVGDDGGSRGVEGDVMLMVGIGAGVTTAEAAPTTTLLRFEFLLRLSIPRTLPVNQMMWSGLAETRPMMGTRETIGVPVGL